MYEVSVDRCQVQLQWTNLSTPQQSIENNWKHIYNAKCSIWVNGKFDIGMALYKLKPKIWPLNVVLSFNFVGFLFKFLGEMNCSSFHWQLYKSISRLFVAELITTTRQRLGGWSIVYLYCVITVIRKNSLINLNSTFVIELKIYLSCGKYSSIVKRFRLRIQRATGEIQKRGEDAFDYQFHVLGQLN